VARANRSRRLPGGKALTFAAEYQVPASHNRALCLLYRTRGAALAPKSGLSGPSSLQIIHRIDNMRDDSPPRTERRSACSGATSPGRNARVETGPLGVLETAGTGRDDSRSGGKVTFGESTAKPLGGDSPLRLDHVDVCEQQIPKFGILKMV
jgi:hypothetical protein